MTQPSDLRPFNEQFFHSYLIDHFRLKQSVLVALLENLSTWKPLLEPRTGPFDDEQFRRTLQIEVRATYYQAIETLFELIFALQPKNGQLQDRDIWYLLSTSDFTGNSERIRSIADGSFQDFDKEIFVTPKLAVPFVRYLFYFGVSNQGITKEIQESIDPIKKFLRAFATEFADRDEYNAIKHSMRVIQTVKSVSISKIESPSSSFFTQDLSNTISFLVARKNTPTHVRVKTLDTPRDFRMTEICASLIGNIYRTREADVKKKPTAFLSTFTEKQFHEATKRTLPNMDMKFTYVPETESTA